jgi:hypothetical protein
MALAWARGPLLRMATAFLGLSTAPTVYSLLHAQGVLREWRLSATPLLAIGGDGVPEAEFFRVQNAWRLTSGAIAVINGGTKEIRVFDARGAYLHSFGREGAGPGEFRGIRWSGYAGDTALVYDASLRRITKILLAGSPRLLGDLPVVSRDERNFDVVGRVADGRWLVHALAAPDVNLRGVQRIPGFAGLMSATATGTVDWLAESPDLSVFVYNPATSQKRVTITLTAFPPSFAVTASGPAIWCGDTSADTLAEIDAASGSRQTIRLPDAPARLTRDIVNAARAREIRAARDEASRALTNEKYGGSYLPSHLPAFETLVAGTGGEVWVQRWAAAREVPAQYVVLAVNGTPIARVTTAPGFRVTDIGPDYVVGIHKDADGVETVRAYRLSRNR